MNRLYRVMWLPGYMVLTGERRKAYDRQAVMTALIFSITVIAALAIYTNNYAGRPVSQKTTVEFVGIVVLAILAKLLYAWKHGELTWQLRRREWRAMNQPHSDSQAELMGFAEKLRPGGRQ